MGLLSYIFLLYTNSSFLIKITLYVFLFLFLYALFLIILNHRKLNLYQKELFFINNVETSKINLNKICNHLGSSDKFGLSSIILSGLKKIIYLHKLGIYDTIVIINIIKYTMDKKMIKEISHLKKNIHLLLIISNILFFLSITVFSINIFNFFQEININFYQELPVSLIFFGINEIIFQLIIGLLLAFPINIVYHKYSGLIHDLMYSYSISMNNFVVLIYYKFHNLK